MTSRGIDLRRCQALYREARTSGLWTTVSRFRREEDGSLLIFGLFCFVIMLLLAGAAFDLMRFEERRTTLQNTLDRAVLAAADLNQTLAPKDVVRDYFLKAGLPAPNPNDIIVQQGTYGEYRTVSAKITEEMPTWFMNMMGIPKLSTPAAGQAEERIGQVEISLVLDVSGSMNESSASSTKIALLRTAAKQFVDTMFDSVEPGKISISIVTYAAQSSIGPTLMSYFDQTNEHNSSYCLEFDAADFNTTAIKLKNQGRIYQRNGHFDPFNSNHSVDIPNCHTTRNFDIQPFSGDRNALKTYIDNLAAEGNTSIDVGMKWGAALLDPSMQPVVDDLIAKGKLPIAFGDRPYPFMVNGKKNREAMKVIVVMTDGANTTEYKLKPGFRSGTSIVRRNTDASYNGSTSNVQYSLWDASRNQWYLPAKTAWRNEPWGDGSTTTCTTKSGKTTCTTTLDTGAKYAANGTTIIGASVPLTWPEVWARMSINWLANNLISPAWGTTERTNWRSSGNTVVERVSTAKDNQAKAVCTAAKDQGTIIFAIGFEAPTSGQNLLKACASTPAHFYAVQGLQIQTAFAAIASSINKLRLTN